MTNISMLLDFSFGILPGVQMYPWVGTQCTPGMALRMIEIRQMCVNPKHSWHHESEFCVHVVSTLLEVVDRFVTIHWLASIRRGGEREFYAPSTLLPSIPAQWCIQCIC